MSKRSGFYSSLITHHSSLLFYPQDWLADEEVAYDLFDRRVCGESFPKRHVVGAREREAAEEQAALAHRPLAVVHYVGLERPSLLVADKGHHVLQGLAHPAPVGKLELPEVVLRRRENLADGRHRFEVEERVAVG